MKINWKPHPRFRLYTTPASYTRPLRLMFHKEDHLDDIATLEAEICRWFDTPAAVVVPMARTGIYLVLRELIRPGQEVVMSPLTIIDVVNMVILAGGVPVFADIRRESCALDPDLAESLIGANTGAVLITHLHGETAGVTSFRDICNRHGVPLVEDAAQAFGATEGGRRLGTIGAVGIFSFGFYKNVNAWRGGMVVTRLPELAARLRRRVAKLPLLQARRLAAECLRGLIIDAATWPPFFTVATHPVVRWAGRHGIEALTRRLDPEAKAHRLTVLPDDYRQRMTRAQAELVLHRLDLVDSDATERIARADRYREGLSGLDGLVVPWPHQGLGHVYMYFPIQTARRDALLRFALDQRRDFAAQHLRNCADWPEFQLYYRNCPNARAAARELVLLPTYPRYPMVEVERNIQVIQDFFKRR